MSGIKIQKKASVIKGIADMIRNILSPEEIKLLIMFLTRGKKE